MTSSIAEDMQTIRQAMSLGAYDYVYRENRLHGMTDKVASELLRSLHNASRGLPAPKHAQPVDPYEATKRVREMAQRVSQKLDRSVDTTVHWDVDKDATATSSGMRKDTLIALACSTGGPQALQVLIPMLPAIFRFRWFWYSICRQDLRILLPDDWIRQVPSMSSRQRIGRY